ncbi:hypothetical protein BaRGS_00012984 [Batillaria attramentaria]|uniref:Uncharacterized protein n=1 Tax=Batillaria attramentaria TaxID=370345 RepID=A0ABD0L876_9CAEN
MRQIKGLCFPVPVKCRYVCAENQNYLCWSQNTGLVLISQPGIMLLLVTSRECPCAGAPSELLSQEQLELFARKNLLFSRIHHSKAEVRKLSLQPVLLPLRDKSCAQQNKMTSEPKDFPFSQVTRMFNIEWNIAAVPVCSICTTNSLVYCGNTVPPPLPWIQWVLTVEPFFPVDSD